MVHILPAAPLGTTDQMSPIRAADPIVTVVTDVPGPTEKRRLLGRGIIGIYPYVPIAVRLRLGFAILSYHDQLAFGITADYDSVSEVQLLSMSVEQEVASLLRSTRNPSSAGEFH